MSRNDAHKYCSEWSAVKASTMWRWAVFGAYLMCYNGMLPGGDAMGTAQASETDSARVQVGQTAPDFTLADQFGKTHQLAAYRGQWVLVYFYPKDDTPGCTTEACGLRDRFAEFQKLKAVVLGISVDSVESHKKFADKFKLPFPLLADTQKQVVQAYGVWGQRQFMGKTYMGISRTSFLIDPKGKIAKIYPKVKPEEHTDEILKDLTQFGANG